MGRDKSFPLYGYKSKIEHIYKDKIAPDTKVVKYLYATTAIKVPENSVVKIRLISQVDEAEIAGVVAEDAGGKDDKQGDNIASIEGEDRQQKYESSNHSVDHAQNSHVGRYLPFLTLLLHVIKWVK